MRTYCLVCRKNTDNNNNSKMIKNKNGRLQLKSQCSICGNKILELLYQKYLG